MPQNVCSTPSGCGLPNPVCKHIVPRSSMVACLSHMPTKATLFPIRASLRPHSFKSQFCDGVLPLNLSASSTPLLRGDHGSLSNLLLPPIPRRGKPSTAPRAFQDGGLFNFKYPPMTKRPRWWWRTLASITYLLPLHGVWMYAETAVRVHPFIENLEFWSIPFLNKVGMLPRWSLIAYFVIAYIGVVRRKEWPHFFRYHVVMGMLLEIVLQAMGMLNKMVPEAIYYGRIGMHLWTFIVFALLFTVIECIRCCLCGKYADVPYAAEAAFIQIPVG